MIVILADTLRADHLGAFGHHRPTSPALDELASGALRFGRAISPAPWTSPSVASIFTSLYPSSHGITAPGALEAGASGTVLSEKHTTLAEAFRAAGYATYGVTSNPWITAELGFAQGFDAFLTLTAPEGSHPHSSRVNQAGLELLGRRPPGAPFFLYLHYMDPHTPYLTLDSERHGCSEIEVPGDVDPPDWTYSEEMARKIQRYDRAIVSMDRQVADLRHRLGTMDLWDGTIVAFLADHGEQFEEHGYFGHGHSVHVEETHVPLWIRADGLAGDWSQTVSTLDLYPTLLELAGLAAPPGLAGVSLASAAGRERRTREGVLSEYVFGGRGPNRRAYVASDGLRLILEFAGSPRDLAPRHAAVVGVFDPTRDPREQTPRVGHPRTDGLLASFYASYEAALAARVEPGATPLDPETVDRLRAIGYVD